MTWSILARDPATGELGAGVATRFFAVGAICPRVEGRVGAVCTQALVNPMFRDRALDRLRGGESAEATVAALIAGDPGGHVRQLHVMRADGTSARHTGPGCIAWAGHCDGLDVSVAGNMLAGEAVILATREAFLASSGPLADRLLAALEAGEAAGGDKRGKQAAALMIASADPYPDLDIRTDDHPDPLAELRRLLAVARQNFVHYRRFLAGADHPGVFDREVINAALAKAGVG